MKFIRISIKRIVKSTGSILFADYYVFINTISIKVHFYLYCHNRHIDKKKSTSIKKNELIEDLSLKNKKEKNADKTTH